MNTYDSVLKELETRARAGDLGALEELRGKLEVQVVPLVRQVLRAGAASALERQLLATAGRLARYSPEQPPDRERLARRVASCFCDSMVEHLRARQPLTSQRLRETVRV